MPSNNSLELHVEESRGAQTASRALALLAGILVFANCLLNSPSRFSERHESDTTLLRPIVSALGLYGKIGTARGVEVRNLIFYGGAALLLAVGAVRLTLMRRRPRYSLDDLLDFRARAGSPYFWWAMWLIVGGLSSYFSHAPSVCRGQAMIHMLWLCWWWPLAAMLTPRHVRTLAAVVAAALAVTAGLGIAYQAVRGGPHPWTSRLSYPFGNELWLAACLLPGVLISTALLLGSGRYGSDRRSPAVWVVRIGWAACAAVVVAALLLTRSRSAMAGLAAAGVAFVCFLVGRKVRRAIILLAVVGGIGATVLLNRVASEGGTAVRAHSIRTRLNFEWPYALRLLMDKPVMGHGDGAYSMLAGQFAREDQLEDPSTLRVDEQSWTGHAHNEYLEQAGDLGIAGSAAYLIAMILTLVYVARFCDRRTGALAGDRMLAAGLGAALVGLVVDHFGEPSIREPGGPAVFLTVWALAWAAVRGERQERFEAQESERLSNVVARLAGVAMLAGAVWLGLVAAADWRAARARPLADAALSSGQFAEAITLADFAGERTLDPFQRNLARLIAIRARSQAFDAALRQSSDPLDKTAMDYGTGAVLRLSELRADVPRFLQLSRLEADLALNLARAAERRGDAAAAGEYQRRFVLAVEQLRADEPFDSQIAAMLWRIHGAAAPRKRVEWVRTLLRGGFVDEQAKEIVRSFANIPDIAGTMSDLTHIASTDAERAQAQWADPLSPETLRLAAMLARMAGESVRALDLARRAVDMYERAGPGLFAAHVAAMAEWVESDVAVNGSLHADENLRRLADGASRLLGRPVGPSEPITGPLGQVRLLVLTSAGRDTDAAAQRAVLTK